MERRLIAAVLIFLALLVVFIWLRVPRRELKPFPVTNKGSLVKKGGPNMKCAWNAVFLLTLSSVLLFAQQESRETQLQAEPSVKAVGSESLDKVDINSASNERLTALKGIGEIYAAMIIRERPYRTKDDLIKRKVIPAAIYKQIKDEIMVTNSMELHTGQQ
jgi:Helix-hairpin-helix motif